MAMQWILTWARTAFISISRKNIPPPLEHAAFDSQNEAVNFAMSLDHPQRRTVRLHLPGGDIAELAVREAPTLEVDAAVMNNDDGYDWRSIPLRWRLQIVVGIVGWIALCLCGLPSHCAGPLCIARLWDFCCYLRACWTLVE